MTRSLADFVHAQSSCIVRGDNLSWLRQLPDACARLIYVDPPFNTGAKQKRQRLVVQADEAGTRVGFGGKKYREQKLDSPSYEDRFGDFCGFLMPRVQEALRCLSRDGSIFIHLDYREAHYVKVAMDAAMGRASFLGEIIWAYDYGGRSKRRWPAKHDTILWYARDPRNYVFNYDEMDRIPYMAPGLVSKEKAARGKTPTDVWWHTIVPTNGNEKTGYPTQKPLGILERVVKVHSEPGDLVLDFFAGSGTTGDAAARHGRRFVLIDQNPEACDVMKKRLSVFGPSFLEENSL